VADASRCSACGPQVDVDEDGCCVRCGRDAWFPSSAIDPREWDRAWLVRHLDGDHEPCVIVYAANLRAAKARGVQQLDNAEWEATEVERRPEFDTYWPGGPSMEVLVASHGFFYVCQQCEREFGAEGRGSHGSEPVIDGDFAYCSPACKAANDDATEQWRVRDAESRARWASEGEAAHG